MATSNDESSSRRRLRIGGFAALLLFVGGAAVYVNRIQSDLGQRVPQALADSGIPGTKAKFSGQDGTLSCASPIADPAKAEDIALSVNGVHKITLDRSCRVNGDNTAAPATTSPASTSTSSTSTTSTTTSTTVAAPATTAAGATTVAPSTAPPTVPQADGAAAAAFEDGKLTLTGSVADEAGRTAIVDAANQAVGEENVTDQLSVDAAAGVSEETAQGVGTLIEAMTANLVSGEVGSNSSGLYVNGVYAQDSDKDAVMAAAEQVGATTSLEPRPDATEADAKAIEDQLNTLVKENPIVFEQNSATLSESSNETLDQLADAAKTVSGLSIVVAGHTDSDGDAGRNQILSDQRAKAVVAALIERGLEPTQLSAVGFGSTSPVLVNGTEDKAASRRVEFKVTVAG